MTKAMTDLKILHLESVRADAELVRTELKKANISFKKLDVDNRADYAKTLADFKPDVILCDQSVPSFTALEALTLLKKSNSNAPFLLVIAPEFKEVAVNLIKDSATAYVLKNAISLLPDAILNTVKQAKLEKGNSKYLNDLTGSQILLNEMESVAKIGSLEIDLITRARNWSAGIDFILGYQPGQISPSFDAFKRRVHPDDVSRLAEEFNYAVANLDAIDIEYRIITPANELKHVHTKLLITKNEVGVAVRAHGFVQDVTEKKTSQLKLSQANLELSHLFNTIDDVFFSRDMISNKLIQISKGCEKMYGYTREEFLAEPGLWRRIIHPDNAKLPQDNDARFAKGETIINVYKIIHKEKGIRWAESKIIPTLDEKGKLIRLDGATRDITERKLMELELQQNELRFQELLENSSEIVTVTNLVGDIIYSTGNVKRILGYSEEEYRAVRFKKDFIHPADQETQLHLFKEVRQNPGQIYQFSWRLRHSQGHWVWVEGSITNLSNIPSVNGIVANFKDISERKLAEEKLLQSEQRYRRIAETAQEGIWVIDENLVTIFVNKKMCDMLEYQAEEIIGKHNYDFKDDEEKIKTKHRIEKRKLGVIETHESTFITKRGKQLICNVSTNGIFESDGSYAGTLAMVTDITERKAQEAALKKSEANLSAIIENTTDLVYSLDKDLRFITFNELFKTTVKQIYGIAVSRNGSALDLLKGLEPETARKWRTIYKNVLKGEQQQFVNEYTHGDAKIYLSYSVNPIWQGGKVIGLSCFSRDITRQKLDEVALIKSEANLRSVFENTDLSIILYNTNFEIVSFNTNASQQTTDGLGKKLKVGSSGFDYFPKSKWPAIRKAIQKVKNKEIVTYEDVFNTKGGNKNWFETKWIGVLNNGDEIVGIILTLENITANKNAQLEREKMTTDIIRRNQDLEQFTYIISHNLRAPVANIKGLTELLHHADVPDTNDEDALNALSSSVNQLDKVILDLNHILEVSKQVNDKKERVDLEQLVEEIKLEIKLSAKKNKAVINCDFKALNEIFTIRSYIYSIFQNLITNSIKYRRKNLNPIINIKGYLNSKMAIISVEDNGKGIDVERSGEHLFGLYKRFDFSVEGKGMGLFMVKKQVEGLDGTIEVQSEVGKGTTFLIELPV
jgi:PAS domain S-box-containing protein